jgi:hypothetical protein
VLFLRGARVCLRNWSFFYHSSNGIFLEKACERTRFENTLKWFAYNIKKILIGIAR